MKSESKRRKFLFVGARIVMGTVLLLGGVTPGLGLLTESQFTPEALSFINSLQETGYLYYMIKSLEIVLGTMFLLNLFIPLSAVIAAPLVINILFFELFLCNSFLIAPILLIACETIVYLEHRKLFNWLFKYQVHTHTNDLDAPDMIILSDLKEKDPKTYKNVVNSQYYHNI
ncbi:hypothetical protein BALOs_2405 [Halobacteriovorax sp. BALOs_7]|uniref:DoxX family protein n=1 Tax=Halobacteriovorax vibrionivorans TaxID=2152716 RepID=A0ABY0IHQ1_9BACT|nr:MULTISPECIES: hypothetical protein [Halobacteriovorax]AYF45402.1 hypothetical protein BALOs_2405 [Halobacteriovorax sp. BALOs_7]RZF22484.1 hypothetical protein DAY19_01560 [Halobacteriovorax vibrionivorans]TGD47675.1 hypothetical protein EP118_06920 [Halobacteriovorax sp. Y22]